MAKAGVLLAAEGLHASSKGARVTFSGKKRTEIDGPFDWASRVPFTDGEEVEVRQVFEATDFPAEILPPADAAREQALRDELQRTAPKP